MKTRIVNYRAGNYYRARDGSIAYICHKIFNDDGSYYFHGFVVYIDDDGFKGSDFCDWRYEKDGVLFLNKPFMDIALPHAFDLVWPVPDRHKGVARMA